MPSFAATDRPFNKKRCKPHIIDIHGNFLLSMTVLHNRHLWRLVSIANQQQTFGIDLIICFGIRQCCSTVDFAFHSHGRLAFHFSGERISQ